MVILITDNVASINSLKQNLVFYSSFLGDRLYFFQLVLTNGPFYFNRLGHIHVDKRELIEPSSSNGVVVGGGRIVALDRRPATRGTLRPLAVHARRRAHTHTRRLRRPEQTVRRRLDSSLAAVRQRRPKRTLGACACAQPDQRALSTLLHTVRSVLSHSTRHVRQAPSPDQQQQ